MNRLESKARPYNYNQYSKNARDVSWLSFTNAINVIYINTLHDLNVY